MTAIESMLDFSGKVVLVTGASQGLGAGIAQRFAEANAGVIVHYNHSQLEAERVATAIRESGGQAIALKADLSQRGAAQGLLEISLQAFGQVDVLINNAGIYPLASLLEMTDEQWDSMLDANLRSVFLCTQILSRYWIEQQMTGNIVNIASIEAFHPAPNHSHYNASKAGVVMHTRSAAFELGQYGIRVNCVSPGLIWREGIEESWADGVNRYLASAPLARLGQPYEVANACLFLASEGASWITGTNLVVDGGVSVNKIF